MEIKIWDDSDNKDEFWIKRMEEFFKTKITMTPEYYEHTNTIPTEFHLLLSADHAELHKRVEYPIDPKDIKELQDIFIKRYEDNDECTVQDGKIHWKSLSGYKYDMDFTNISTMDIKLFCKKYECYATISDDCVGFEF